jgi:hypothetical protein
VPVSMGFFDLFYTSFCFCKKEISKWEVSLLLNIATGMPARGRSLT